MDKLRKTWREKLHDSKDLPKVVEVNEKMSRRWGTGTVVIPAPLEVDEIMKQVPEGRLITINQIREILAGKHSASFGWPITTGIFVGIAARAAEEDNSRGTGNITPYWRTIKTGGYLNSKYPGGLEAQTAKLEAEGHFIEAGKGKKEPKVRNYEKALVEV